MGQLLLSYLDLMNCNYTWDGETTSTDPRIVQIEYSRNIVENESF